MSAKDAVALRATTGLTNAAPFGSPTIRWMRPVIAAVVRRL
jgi:hypothetical protein